MKRLFLFIFFITLHSIASAQYYASPDIFHLGGIMDNSFNYINDSQLADLVAHGFDYNQYLSEKKKAKWGYALIPIGSAVMASGLLLRSHQEFNITISGHQFNAGTLLLNSLGVATIILGSSLAFSALDHINSSLSALKSPSVALSATENGVGLSLFF